MPRDLGDVIHYFIPEAADQRAPADPLPTADEPVAAGERPHRLGVSSLPIVTVPVENSDVLRAAFIWNLAVEIARLGATATLVEPDDPAASTLWTMPGRGPLGAELVLVDGGNAGALYDAAAEIARSGSGRPGIVLACAPSAWLLDDKTPPELLRWALLLCEPDADGLARTRSTALAWRRRAPGARLGVTIHGVRRVAEARAAFDDLSKPGPLPLTSYGLLVDDLHVYRAIVARRPIGLAHPQSPAARALGDVARLLLEDAKESVDA